MGISSIKKGNIYGKIEDIDIKIQEANKKLNDLISKWQQKEDIAQKKDYKIAVNFQELKLENLMLKKQIALNELQIARCTNDINKLAKHL